MASVANDFSGKAIIVTGAAGGIGKASAHALAARGASLVLVDRAQDRLDLLSRELQERYATLRLLALVLDVTSEADMARMAQAAVDTLRQIDALVAAAGILRTSGHPRTTVETTFEEWKAVINVNLTGTFLSNKAVLPAMIQQGRGDIVNISSTSGRQGRAFDAPYCASKFGIIGFSESLAEEVSRLGIRVQTLLPDAVDTPLWQQNESVAIKPRDLLPADRVADFIVYLLGLPRDTYLLNPTLYPLRVRVKK